MKKYNIFEQKVNLYDDILILIGDLRAIKVDGKYMNYSDICKLTDIDNSTMSYLITGNHDFKLKTLVEFYNKFKSLKEKYANK